MNIKYKTYQKLPDKLNYRLLIQKAMMSDNPTIILKLETTNIDPMEDRVIRISAIKTRFEDYELKEIDRFDELVNPERAVDDFVLEKNNITQANLDESDSIKDVMARFYNFCGGVINLIGFNIDRFLLPFLKNAGFYSGEMITVENKIDIMAMCISLLEPNKDLCNYKQKTVLKYLDIKEDTELDNLLILFNELYALSPKGLSRAKVIKSNYWEKSHTVRYIYFDTDFGRVALNCNTGFFKETTPAIFNAIDMDYLNDYICEKGKVKTINDFAAMYVKHYAKKAKKAT